MRVRLPAAARESLARPVARRRFLQLSAAGAAVAGIAACGTTGGAAAPAAGGAGRKIGFALASYVVPRYVKLDLPNFETAATAAGFETLSIQSENEPDKQLDGVSNLLSRDLSALALQPVSAESGVTLVRKAKAAGVPVIAYNQIADTPDLAAFVARDSVQMGREMAVTATETLGGVRGRYILVSGQAADPVSEGILKGWMEVLQPGIDSGAVTVLNQQYNNKWDPESARQQVENALTAAGNNVQVVLCANDALAGGALQALKAQGLEKKTVVTGQDAETAALRAILLGEQTATWFTEADTMGRTAAELCVKLANGETVTAERSYPVTGGEVPFFVIPIIKITAANMVEYVKKYSPAYVDAKAVFQGIPADKLPPGAAELLASV
ncbi:substrate-binding domain-containing protein [Pseudonocardia alni]|uniref:substrate-binding domain-containing protein n=1 Tax=Pseudonocardia alni TaxID=33907 RepID=UPI0033C1BCB8